MHSTVAGPVRRAGHHRRVAAITSLRPGDEVAGVYACTRKDRLLARTGTPYLALELRDRTGALPGRAFKDADVLAGRFDRGELVRVRGRVERFRDELQVEVHEIARAEAADPAARCCLLPAAVDVLVAVGDLPGAEDAAALLAAEARAGTVWLAAETDRARGTVLLARGSAATAAVRLRAAHAVWLSLGVPYEAARAELLLGRARRAAP